MKRRRALLFSLLMVLVVLGIPAGFALGEYHHLRVNEALVAAVTANDTKTALAALNAGAEADYPHQDKTPRPVWMRWLDQVFGFHAPPEDAGPSLLALAVQHDNTVLVKALLEKGATDVQGTVRSLHDRNSPEEDIPLLAVAAEAGNLAMCRELVNHGADVNQGDRYCPLKRAAAGGHSTVIRFLFERGATLDIPDGMDDYSLMDAARSGDAESVRLLLAHGANVKYVGRFDTALTAAVEGGNLAIVKLVVKAGGNVNGGGAYTTVLEEAAQGGDVEIVRYLLKKGADINAGARWNRTPLMSAVREGRKEVVKLLLEQGADCRTMAAIGGVEGHKGDTALSLAQQGGNREIVQMLKKAGAKE